MSPRKRKLKLSAEQKRQWAIDGYLHVPAVLSPPEVKHFTRAVDQLYRAHLRREEAHPSVAMLRHGGQRCLRAYDFEKPTPELLERCTPRQRRLLGDLGHEFRPGDYFVPPPDHEEIMSGRSG